MILRPSFWQFPTLQHRITELEGTLEKSCGSEFAPRPQLMQCLWSFRASRQEREGTEGSIGLSKKLTGSLRGRGIIAQPEGSSPRSPRSPQMSLWMPGVADSLQQEVVMQRLRRDRGGQDGGGCASSCSPTPARLPLLLPPSSTVSAWAQLLLWCGESAPSAGHEAALQLHTWLVVSGEDLGLGSNCSSHIWPSGQDSAGASLCGPQQPTTPGTRILVIFAPLASLRTGGGAVTPIEKERRGTCPHPMKPSCLEEVGLDLCSEGGQLPSLKDWQTWGGGVCKECPLRLGDKRRPDQEALPTLHRGLLRQLHFAQVSSASTASDPSVGGGGCLPQMTGSLADPLESVCVRVCKLWKDCSKAKLMARNALNKIEKLSKQRHHFGFRMTPGRRAPGCDGRVARGPLVEKPWAASGWRPSTSHEVLQERKGGPRGAPHFYEGRLGTRGWGLQRPSQSTVSKGDTTWWGFLGSPEAPGALDLLSFGRALKARPFPQVLRQGRGSRLRGIGAWREERVVLLGAGAFRWEEGRFYTLLVAADFAGPSSLFQGHGAQGQFQGLVASMTSATCLSTRVCRLPKCSVGRSQAKTGAHPLCDAWVSNPAVGFPANKPQPLNNEVGEGLQRAHPASSKSGPC
ncbi:hypothetical protein L345_10702, partial [Ophiophagus hannah]